MFKRKLATIALSVLTVLPVFGAPLVSADSGTTCTEYTKSVQLSPSIPFLNYDLVGTLCYKGTLEGKTLQVLVHGAGYNSYYWDFPLRPEKYSYVQDAVNRGYATFNLDRIGSGKSGKPDGFLVNVDNSAFTIHQVVQALRDGSLTGHSFGQVVGVGHSFGSLISVAVASQYTSDFDAVVLTGFLHNLGTAIPTLIQSAIPTFLDPKLAHYPANYFSNTPGTRAQVFYNQAYADADVIATDEANRDAIALGLLMDIGRHFTPESQGITVPVYLIIGENDLVYCGNGVDCTDQTAVFNHESAFFSPAAQLEVRTINHSGHNLQLHKNVENPANAILNWIDAL